MAKWYISQTCEVESSINNSLINLVNHVSFSLFLSLSLWETDLFFFFLIRERECINSKAHYPSFSPFPSFTIFSWFFVYSLLNFLGFSRKLNKNKISLFTDPLDSVSLRRKNLHSSEIFSSVFPPRFNQVFKSKPYFDS